uniref:Uncharacterized protein n=1 Tax=Tanacetum cinerariifolium TaxID=118510 RepID=A0A6L2L7S3_TANCI|nr:hypothetical protein [Tanacetum cinerariifolium]
MVTILEKSEHNVDFHPMVDFFEAYPLRARIAQSSALPPVADEPASPLRDVSQGEACPTDSGFIADQDRITIAKSSTLPHDSAPRVTSPAADEGKDRKGVAAEGSRDDALIKGRNLDEGEAAAERASDDTEDMATILTSMDAATVLASGAAEVPTGSGSIPATGPPAAEVPTGSDVVPTASLVFATTTVVTPYRRRKGKEVMVESDTPKKQKVQEKINAQVARELKEQLKREDQRRSEQIARDAEITRIHAELELQIMIDGLHRNNETIAKYLQECHQFASEIPIERRKELISDLVKYQDNYAKTYKFQSQQRKPWTKKQKRDYYMAVIRSNLGWKVKDFRGMTFEEVEGKFNSVWKQIEDFIPMGSKEEAKRIKRKCLILEQESAKKFKSSEEITEEAKSPDEVPEEKIKDMMQLVPIEEETLSNRPPTGDKEMELWVELRRLYEPDDEDQLWTHTQNLMHALVEWKLYDSCGVHHVTAKDKEIFMLVEKDYPLRKVLQESKGRIVGNKMHKEFPLPGIEFPLTEEVPTASEEGCHCQKKREATARKIALLSKSRRNCQSKSNDSFTKSVSLDTSLCGVLKPWSLSCKVGMCRMKVATWDDLTFKLIILGWNVKHRNFAKR